MPKKMHDYKRMNPTRNYYCIHETGEMFNGVREIAEAVGLHPANISKHMTGIRPAKKLEGLTIYKVKGCIPCGKPLETSDMSKRCIKMRYYSCKSCEKTYNFKYYYNYPLGAYRDALVKQDNSCAICGVSADTLSKSLSIDHNHANGEVRGLLCGNCNTALGLFRDNPNIIAGALKYLRERGDCYS